MRARAFAGIFAAGLLAVAVAHAAPSDPSAPGAAPDAKGPDGSTPLQWAVYRNDVAEVKRLLAAGA
ncbi:MAG TPA: hypothetical protein VI653_11705, partial [Steroidobacteraceae bacterium]